MRRASHSSLSKRGFNLVEAAIVLGVVGLIIGGIWVAASTVRQNMRINKMMSDVQVIVANARRLYPLTSYPASGFTNVTPSALVSGVFPGDYTSATGGPTSSDGVVMGLALGCNPGACPGISVLLYMTAQGFSNVTRSECIQLVRRLGGAARNTADLQRLYVTAVGGGASVAYTPPFDASTVDCQSSDGYLELRYSP